MYSIKKLDRNLFLLDGISSNNIQKLYYQLSHDKKCNYIKDDDFEKWMSHLRNNTGFDVYVMIYTSMTSYIKYEHIPVGIITTMIEPKIIHGLCYVLHVEDLVVDKKHRNKGIAKSLLAHCIQKGKEYECYKVILNCSDEYLDFYDKMGFFKDNNQMIYKI